MNVRLIPVGRIYESEEKARDAIRRVTEEGYAERLMSVIASAEESEDKTAKAIIASHDAGDVPAGQAIVYARQLHQGRALVLITPPFTHGRYIERLLDEGKPVELDEPLPDPVPLLYTAAPLSNFLGLPVLESDNPTPLSSKLGWSTLSPGLSRFSKWFGGPLLSSEWTFSSKLGWKLLSDKPTPFSSKFGLKTLSDNPAPLSSRLGWKLLIDDPAPLSSRVDKKMKARAKEKGKGTFGLPLLIDSATPLSSKLGLPVLLRKR